ncbi:MAG TPA: DNA-binding protein [Spirochaeta sp.]|nr:DNA-binding protein [Spirochaeta sp.]
MGLRGEVFSCKATTDNGKRTYFFNVKENRQGDLFLNVVESKPHAGTGYERHSIVVFEEDMEIFTKELQKSLDYIKDHREH